VVALEGNTCLSFLVPILFWFWPSFSVSFACKHVARRLVCRHYKLDIYSKLIARRLEHH
jgi:hypothetical protein